MRRRCSPISRFTSRRLIPLLLFLSLLSITFIGILTSAVPTSPRLSAFDPKTSVPKLAGSLSKSFLNPFRRPLHPLSHQRNDRYGNSSWWTDWNWLSTPFSHSITLDNERALLPPLLERQPIYCYYDASAKKTQGEKDAESELLLTWRRAWWAHGFRPVILSAVEAASNPIYNELQGIEVNPYLKEDLMRWLAWDTMGGGILSEYTILPTVPRKDAVLLFLRRGEFPSIIRWAALGDGFLAGQQAHITAAIRATLYPTNMNEKQSVLAALPVASVKVDNATAPLAYYSASIIEKKYAKIVNKENKAQTLRNLNELINYHLLTVWQNSFPDGIEVVKPHPEHTTAMLRNIVKLSKELASCPRSLLPTSCAPNMPKCIPCVAGHMEVSTPPRYRSSPRIFSMSAVPHPWTFALVDNARDSINITWIRESSRDTWLSTVTQAYLGSGVSSNRRIMEFKEIVAGENATAHSLWLTAEDEIPSDIDWYFGFAIPKNEMSDGKSKSPVPADRVAQGEQLQDIPTHPTISAEDVFAESILDRARRVVSLTKASEVTRLRASIEAWNMADFEAWKFTRAFHARRKLEREQWGKAEAKNGRGSGIEKGRSAWNRW